MPPPLADTKTATDGAFARLMWWLLLIASAIAVAGLAYAVSQRWPYPHELEWMEGALADHAARVAGGLPIYCEPSAEHVPFLYAPMLFWLGGIGIALGCDGIITLRLVAIVFSIGSAMCIGHWVRRETGRVLIGLVASGLFLAGYGWLAWWYDLARNDSLFVFWCLMTAYWLRHGGRGRWIFAGLFATAALLAKQSAVMWLPAVGVGALIADWRTAIRFGISALVFAGAALATMHWTSDGWSTFYLFEMPRHHGWVADRRLGFWLEDVVPMLPLLLLGLAGFVAQCNAGRSRDALYLAAVGSGSLMASWFSRMHVGGFDNVMMYGFAGACVLGPIAAAGPSRLLRLVGPLVLLLQFGWLGVEAWQRDPATTLLPSAAHRRAHEQLRAFVGKQNGPVWIPGHGHIAYREGKGTGAHGQAIFDLMQMLPKLPNGMLDIGALANTDRLRHLSPRAQRSLTLLMTSVHQAMQQRRFAAIVVDLFGAGSVDAFTGLFAAALAGLDGKPGSDDDPYARLPEQLLTQPRAINPLLGYEAHSPYALIARD